MDAQQHVLNVSACSVNSSLKKHLFEFVRLIHEMITGSWGEIHETSQTKYEGGGCGGSIKYSEANEASAAKSICACASDFKETLFCFCISIHVLSIYKIYI